jgi:hypothetical protein
VDVRSQLRVVLTSRQLLVAQVAAALCSSVEEYELGDWEPLRVPLGEGFDALARRLAAVRELEPACGAEVVSVLSDDGEPLIAVEVALPPEQVPLLRVAAERMLGILATDDRFGELVDADLVGIVGALG